jgi:transcriptional regulator with XRE-family HTH domain
MENNLRKIRLSFGFKQAQIAQILNISRPTLSNWERGVAQPSLEQLIQLSNVYSVSIDYILRRNQVYTEFDHVEDVFEYCSKKYSVDEMKILNSLFEQYLKIVDKYESSKKRPVTAICFKMSLWKSDMIM